MKLKPFKDLIALSKEKLDEALAPIRARQVKAKAELQLAELDSKILNLETQVQEICACKDIDLVKLMDTLDEVALLERRKEQYAEVLAQLFPEEEKSAA